MSESLFDISPEDTPQGESSEQPVPHVASSRVHVPTQETAGADTNEWQEVPQALFDSWPVRKQLAYCARRDEDSAMTTYDPWWEEFYTDRAMGYLGELS